MNEFENEIKQLLIDSLNLEDLTINDIKSEEALFGDGLGLDSIDALELGITLQKKYNLKIKAQDADVKQYFYSVRTLADYIQSQT